MKLRSIRLRVGLSGVAAVSVGLFSTTISGGAVTTAAVRDTTIALSAVNAPPGPASERQAVLARDILAGLPASRLAEIRIGNPPPDWEGAPSDAAWLYYKVRASDSVDFKRGYWQGLLVSGLFRSVGATLQLPPLHGHTFTMVRPDGTEEFIVASTTDDDPLDIGFAAETSDRLAERIRDSARSAKARVSSIAFARPLGKLAPEIVVTVDDPKEFMKAAGANIRQILEPVAAGQGGAAGEGAYLEIRDRQGQIVMISAFGVRTQAGTSIVGEAYKELSNPSTRGFGHLLAPPD